MISLEGEGNRSSSASLRGRFVASTLALSFAGFVLSGCIGPDVPSEWEEKGAANQDYVRRVYQDKAGCYWLDDSGVARALMVVKGKQPPYPQWCDVPHSDRTAPSVAPRSAKTGDSR